MSRADKLFDKILLGEEVHASFSKLLQENFKINGKSMKDWRDYFYVEMPIDNLTPGICKKISGEIAKLYQEASFYYSVANAETQLLERSSDSSYREKYTAIVANWKKEQESKLPAAATLEILAKFEQDDVYSATAKIKVAKGFWKDVLDSLDTCRKLIDNATFNNNIEARLSGEHT